MAAQLRKIQPQDNASMERIIKSVFIEFGLPLTGTAYEDHETSKMYEAYQLEGDEYYVIEEYGKVLGGGGIKALKEHKGTVCELQKMYFDPAIRGKGYGQLLMDTCLLFAKEKGYTTCYLETLPELEAAIHLYRKNGFRHINGPLGNTGHSSCNVWMIKDL